MKLSNHTYLLLIFVVALLACITAAACEKVRLVNMTRTWDKHDQQEMDDAAARGCKKRFPDMPCLRIFIKLNERDYSVICGGERAAEWKGYNVH
jgi:hypothetical protein